MVILDIEHLAVGLVVVVQEAQVVLEEAVEQVLLQQVMQEVVVEMV